VKNTTIAIDLAKSVFEVGVSDRPGHVAAPERRLDAGHLIAWGVAIMMGLGMVLTYGHFVH
jgi:hypothetical protein